MELEVGKFYKIVISINGTTLTYRCKVLSINNIFVSFIDNRKKEYSYNLNFVVSFKPTPELEREWNDAS